MKQQKLTYRLLIFLLPIVLFIISSIKCDIRCHCNQPVCVRTGYMCKSKGPQAGCFVEHSGYVNMDRSSDISRHGCIEMLPVDERISCLELAIAINSHHSMTSSHVLHRHSIYLHQQNRRPGPSFRTHNKTITCCMDDMCNYVKTVVDESNNQESQYLDSEHQRHHHRYHHYRPTMSGNSDQFDSLGRHLQESYGIDDSLQHDGSVAFIIFFILFLFVILIILIFFVIRYIRNDVNNNQQKITQKFCKPSDHLLPPTQPSNKKSSMLADLRSFMNPRKNFSYPGCVDVKTDHQQLHEKCDAKLSLKSPTQNKSKQHSLLLSVKVDVNECSYDPSVTKLDNQDIIETQHPSNLPNIISVHSLPTSTNDYNIEINDGELNNGKETTFDILYSHGMEKQNSIYMSPPLNHQKPTSKSDFDLISNTASSNKLIV